MRRLAGAVLLLALMATTCGPSRLDRAIEEARQASLSSRINFAIDTDEPENFVLRFHPEDAELYSLREVNPLMSVRTPGALTVEIERLEPWGPTTVCLRNNVYVENVSEQDRALVFKAGECTELQILDPVGLTWGAAPM